MSDTVARYVAGVTASAAGVEFSLWRLHERDGERVGAPELIIPTMNEEQARHLHLQMSNVLGILGPSQDTDSPQTPDDTASSGS